MLQQIKQNRERVAFWMLLAIAACLFLMSGWQLRGNHKRESEWTPVNGGLKQALAALTEEGGSAGSAASASAAADTAAAAPAAGSGTASASTPTAGGSGEASAPTTPARGSGAASASAPTVPAAGRSDTPASVPSASGTVSPAQAASATIDLNSATAAEFDTLPGIGSGKAQAIVDYRTAAGGFKSTDELMKVKGIGAKTYEKLKLLVSVSLP